MLEIASNGLLRFLVDYTLALSATHADVGSVVSTLEQGVTNPVRVTGEGAALILDPGDGLMDLLTGIRRGAYSAKQARGTSGI